MLHKTDPLGRVEPLESRIVLAVNLVSGPIPDGTTWLAGDIQYVTADATVPVGATLTIEPGAIIKFTNGSDLLVNGRVLADGTAAKPIVFTSFRDDSAGGDTNGGGASSGAAGDWSSITFGSSSTGSVMNRAEVRFGGGSSAAGALILDHAELSLTNSVVSRSATNGVRIIASDPTLTANTFSDNALGGGFTTGAVSMDLESDPAISGVTMINNRVNGLLVDGGSLTASRAWNDPDIVYWLPSEITVSSAVTLTVAPGQIVKQGGGTGILPRLVVNGTLIADGTAAQPIIFTSFKDDTAGGDTNNNAAATAPAKGDWDALQFNPGSTGNVMDHTEVRFGGTISGAGMGAIYVDQASLTLSNSTVRDSTSSGIDFHDSTGSLTGNTFLDNGTTVLLPDIDGAIRSDVASSLTITGSTASGNTINGIVMENGVLSSPRTWNATGLAYYLPEGVTVGPGTTLTIAPGVVVKTRVSSGQLSVEGTLMAPGTAAQPIIFTDERDDTAGGDTDNTAAAPAPGDTQGLAFTMGSTGSVLDHVEIRYAGSGVSALHAGTSVTLRNSVIRDPFNDGISAFNGATVNAASNVIFASQPGSQANGLSAVLGGTITAFNQTIDGLLGGAFAFEAGSSITLTNSLVTNHEGFGVDVFNGGTVTVRFSNVFNPTALNGNYPGTSQTGTNGNISLDPRYFNRANAQFQLKSGSPAIDAGTSTGAPTTDHLGNSRFDDFNVLNTGAGPQPFFDMGAFERQTSSTSNVDLRAVTVTGPAAGLQQQMATVNWTIENVGAGAALGSWFDSIYLSADTVLTPDDLLLGEAPHTGDLGAGASYMASTQVTLPGVLPGDYYFIVRANSHGEVFEGLALTNNAAASAAKVAMDLPALALGTPLGTSLPAAGDRLFYKIAAPTGADLALALDGANGASNELYVKFGDLPSRQLFDVRGTAFDSPDQSLTVADTVAGNYYAMVLGTDPADPKTFTITTSLPAFAISDISPARGSNTGNVTINIHGAQFDANSLPKLVTSTNQTIMPEAVYFTDSGSIAATFDLNGAALGAADVQVVNTGDVTTTLPNALDIVAGKPGKLSATLTMPERVRTTNFVAYLEYTNTGDTDLRAPLARLTSPGENITLGLHPDRSDATTTLWFLAANDEGPAGILPPGASIRVPIYGRGQSLGLDALLFEVAQVGGQTVPWAEFEPLVRPENLTQAEFAPIYAQVQANVGSTFAQYGAALSGAATLLPRGEAGVPSLQDVFGVVVDRAAADIATSVSGRLFLGNTAHPLPGVELALYDEATGAVLEAVSLSDGTFLFPVVADGDYELSVEGFGLTAPVTVNVAADADLGNVIATRGGAIAGGVLLDIGGLPLREVPVVASGADGTLHSTVTGDDGRYTLTGLPADTYEITALGSTFTLGSISGITLGAGEVKAHVNLVLKSGGSISGIVTGPGGPIADATVVANDGDGGGFGAVTDATGAYSIPSLAGATYTVTASAAGLARVITTGVSLPAGGSATGINFTLGTAGGISGQITAAVGGAPAVSVLVTFTGPGGTFQANTDDNGDYSIAGLKPGNYTVTTSSAEFMTKTASAPVVAGSTLSLPITLADRGRVSGNVTAIGGGAVPKVIVSAVDEDGVFAATTTDASGHYEIDGFDGGTFQIILGDEFTPGIRRTAATFNFNDTDETVNFPIPVAGTVSGTVFDTDGVTPLENAQVGLVQNGEALVTMFTDDLGQYVFVAVSAGTYQLEATGSGLDFPVITGVTLGANNSITGQNFTPGDKAISGLIRDANTLAPLAGATVSLSRIEAGLAFPEVTTLTTAANGTFNYTGALVGDYRLTVEASGHAFKTQSVTVTGGAPPNVTIGLSAGAGIVGTIRDAGTGQPLADADLTLSTTSGPLLQISARSDDSGAYEFSGLAQGLYDLTVSADGHSTVVMTNVSVAAGTKTLAVSLDDKETRVRGTITNGSNPLGGVLISARDAAGRVVGEVITALDGTYDLASLPAGQFDLFATALGYQPSGALPVTLGANADLTGRDFTLAAVGLSDIRLNNIVGTIKAQLAAGIGPSALLQIALDKGYSLDSGDQALIGSPLEDDECELQRRAVLKLSDVISDFRDGLEQSRDALGDLGDLAGLRQQLLVQFHTARELLSKTDSMLTHLPVTSRVPGLDHDVLSSLQSGLQAWDEEFLGRAGQYNFIGGQVELAALLAGNGPLAKLKQQASLQTAALSRLFGVSATDVDLPPDQQQTVDQIPDVRAGDVPLIPGPLLQADLSNGLNALRQLEATMVTAFELTSAYGEYKARLEVYYGAVETFVKNFNALRACTQKCTPADANGPAPGLAEGGDVGRAAAVGGFDPFHIGSCKPSPNPSGPVPDGFSLEGFAGFDVIGSFDPNDKIGPVGFGAQNFIQPGVMPFKVLFENDPALGATAAAQKVIVTDVLDADLDLSTFEFTSFGFGAFEFDVPKGVANFETTLDLRPDGIDLQVPVTLSLDVPSRTVTAAFESLDPLTGLAPDDVDAGFLPVNDASHAGEGFFTYNVQPNAGLATGAVITNQASIVFDQNTPILTPTTTHTLDVDAPASAIATAPTTIGKSAIKLDLQGTDSGSGIGGFDVFVSDNGGDFMLALSNVPGPTATFVGQPGHTYEFFSVARDNVGNTEAAAPAADTTITVAPTEQVVMDKANPKLAFIDGDGTAVKVAWTGLGTATVERFKLPNGQGDLFGIAIAGSDAKSKLTITPTKGDTEINTVDAVTPLSALSMKGVHVLEHIDLMGAVPSVTLGNLVAGADITLGGAVAKGVKVIVGDVTGDSDLTSAGPLASVQAVRWMDGAITASSLGKLTIAGAKKPALIVGDFGADLTLTDATPKQTLGTTKIAGAITGGDWNITGNAGAISALSTAAGWNAFFTGNLASVKTTGDASGTITAKSIKTFTVGGDLTGAQVTLTQAVDPKLKALSTLKITGFLDNTTIRSAGHLGSLTAGAFRDSGIFAGVKGGTTGLPTALADFDAIAQIGSVTVKGIKNLANAFVNSNLAAQMLGKITLRDVLPGNGNTDFGLAADKIAALTIYQGKLVQDKFAKIETAANNEAVRHDDFVARVF